MSRQYDMLVEITEFNPYRQKQVKEACCKEWTFDLEELSFKRGANRARILTGKAMGTLCGGESEDEFVDRLAKAIWKANKGYCEIEVHSLYLESLPYDDHCRDDDDYKRLMGK
jgi:hypothetical protein